MSKGYGPVQANRGIDLDVDPQSIHAVLGENGAGKSTLMKMIYGVERPDEGQIEWQGREVRPASSAEARRLGIGMVFPFRWHSGHGETAITSYEFYSGE